MALRRFQLSHKLLLILLWSLGGILYCRHVSAQEKESKPKGKLFIIGGGNFVSVLLQDLLDQAKLAPGDYIAVLPMASEEPDSAYIGFRDDLQAFTKNSIINFNFRKGESQIANKIDSLKQAKLIFITGGDQSRLMAIILHTAIYSAIHAAYRNGSIVAGTSAGAAAMPRYMITGRELSDSVYHSTFPRLRDQDIDLGEGLDLVSNVIIDQHFIVRSRYNRLISALVAHPTLTAIGIDESTAIIVNGRHIRVSGAGQVVIMQQPIDATFTPQGLLHLNSVQLKILTAGDSFDLPW